MLRFSPLLELDISIRTSFFVIAHIILYAWMRYVVAPAKVGRQRLFYSLGTMPVLLFMAFLFDADKPLEFVPALHAVHNFLWLTATKILAFCGNRGQLVKSYDSGNNTAFALGLLFPITVAFKEKRVERTQSRTLVDAHAFMDAQFSVIKYEGNEFRSETLKTALRLLTKVKIFPFSSLNVQDRYSR